MVKACHQSEMARPGTECHGSPVALTHPPPCKMLEETRCMTVTAHTVTECTARTVILSLVQTHCLGLNLTVESVRARLCVPHLLILKNGLLSLSVHEKPNILIFVYIIYNII